MKHELALLLDKDERQKMLSEYDRIIQMLGEPGASEKAARTDARPTGKQYTLNPLPHDMSTHENPSRPLRVTILQTDIEWQAPSC